MTEPKFVIGSSIAVTHFIGENVKWKFNNANDLNKVSIFATLFLC